MDERFHKKDILTLILALAGMAVFLFMYPHLFPESAMRAGQDRQIVREDGIAFIENLGYDLAGYSLSVRLEYDEQQLKYMNRVFGTRRTNQLTDSAHVFHWAFRWSQESPETIHLGSSGSDEAEEVMSRIVGDLRLNVDLLGRPIHFEFRDSKEDAFSEVVELSSQDADRDVAEGLAERLFDVYGGAWSPVESEEKSSNQAMTRRFLWHRDTRILGESVSLEIFIQNGTVRSFRKSYTIPKMHLEEASRSEFNGITSVVLFLVTFVFVVITFVKRLRADLMDLKSGLIPAFILLIGWLLQYWVQTGPVSRDSLLEFIIGFVVTMPFVCGGIWALYAVGESLTREVWSEKLRSLDVMHRKFLVPNLGLSIFRGIGLIFIFLGCLSLLDWAGVHLFNGYFSLGDSYTLVWSASWPSLYAMSHGLFNSLYIVVTLCLFMLSMLKRRLGKWMFIVPLSFILWALVRFPIPFMQPWILRLFINGLVGLLFVWFFIRYDFLTVLIAAIGLPLVYYCVALLAAGSGLFFIHGMLLGGLMILVLGLGLLSYRSEPLRGEIASYVPAYLERIYERERIHRELEIARNVQLNFLPRQKPRIKGIDIASLCVPAKEVGGDYYDFIEISPRKLGIVIGDVSGKGISAAFYMTLTKGFLRSQAKSTLSPREVLINMNELFYENAERGMFISMIYGIIDLDAKTLTFARAGHNPMILRRTQEGEAEELNPPGIALGLESGEVFDRTIEERIIGIQKDDAFLFYTDGLNEAQNRALEEFGEDRLIKLIDAYDGLNAEELLNQIQWEIQRFTADAAQHDDMTAVVARIL